MPEPSPLAVLGWIARIKTIAARSSHEEAEVWAIANRAPPEAMRLSKAAIGAGGSSDLGSPGGLNVAQWVESARTQSVLFRLLADNAIRRIPLQTRAVVMSGGSAAAVGEGAAIPVGKILLTPVLLSPIKVSGAVIQTNELLREVGAVGQMSLNKELLACVSTAVDAKFLSVAAAGAPTSASAGPTAVDAAHDLRKMLLSVAAVGSKPYFICSTNVAVMASTLSDASGAPAFPAMSTTGGEMSNLPAIVSDAAAPGELYAVDARSVCADALAPTVDVITQGDAEMSTTPIMNSATGTGSTMLVSLWQADLTGFRVNVVFGIQMLRTTAAYKLTAINWGGP